MKVTDSDAIKSSEKDLIDAIAGDLDWEAIEHLFKEKHNLVLEDELEYKNGDIVIHNNQIAYKLDFDIKVKLSVLFDRKGECLEVRANDKHEEGETLNGEEKDIGDSETGINHTEQQDETRSDIELLEMEDEEEDAAVLEMAIIIAGMIPDMKKEL